MGKVLILYLQLKTISKTYPWKLIVRLSQQYFFKLEAKCYDAGYLPFDLINVHFLKLTKHRAQKFLEYHECFECVDAP